MPGGLRDVSQRFDADASGYVAEVQKIIQANREVLDSIRQVQKLKLDVDVDGALGKIAAVRSALAGLGDKTVTVTVKYVTVGDKPGAGVGLGGDHAAMVRELRDISASADMTTASLGRMEDHLAVISKSVQDSSASLDMQTQMLRDNADAHNMVAVAAGRSSAATRDAAAVARDVAAAGYMNAMAARMAGGGGGGGVGAAVAAAGGGGPDPGTAAATFATVAAWVRRVYPAVHWAMMATNEVLATAGPAAIAAGGAALVGMQGGEQLRNRYQAMSAVAESLGPTSGQSLATFLRTPGTLQQLQNMYGSGEMYSIAGAGINALRGGAGGAFLQLGQNTLQMLSGAAADFVLALQKGLGSAAGQIVGGGTHYLQQFGLVAGNIGQSFINAAPYLPGVGSMLLGGLQGVTGLARNVTGALGPGLLPLLGFEAGARYGPTLVGGAGALLGRAGGALGDVALGGRLGAGRLATLLGGAGSGIEGAGLALGAMTAPEIGLAAMAAILVQRGLTAKTAAQQQYGAMASNLTLPNLVSSMSTLATAGMPGGIPQIPPGKFAPLSNQAMMSGLPQFAKASMDMFKQAGLGIGDLFTGQWSKALHSLGSIVQDAISPGGTIHALGQLLGIVPPAPNAQQAAFQQLGTAFGTWSNVLGAPSQVKDIWKNMGEGALSTANALNVLMQAGVNVNTAFQANHQLTAKAAQQIKDYVAGYQAMTGTVPGGATGGTLAAINAVTVAGGLQSSKLATTNAALDQIVQIASGGAAGTAALTSLLAAVPSKGSVSPLTTQGAAAWTAFASTTQPSVMAQLQQQTDWMRTAQVLGAFGTGGMTQANMAKFLIGQALPSATRMGPMGLAQLSTIAQQYGMAPFAPGESAKQMQQQFHQFLQGGDTAKQYLAALTGTTIKVSNIPADARQFITTATGGFTQSLAQGIDLYGQGVQQQFMAAAGAGKLNRQLISQYAGLLGTAGYSPQSAGAMAAYAAHVAGVAPGKLPGIQHLVAQGVVNWENKVKPLPHQQASGSVNFNNKTKQLAMQHADGIVQYNNKVPPAPSPVGHGVIIYSAVVQSAGVAGAPGVRLVGHQTGGLVPGSGRGDIVPSMLEPGEAIVPRSLVPLVAPILAAHGVPGFGGTPMSSGTHFAAGGVVPAGASAAQLHALISADWKVLDQLYAQGNKAAIAAYWKNTMDPLYAALDALKGKATGAASAVQKTAQAAQAYAKQVTASTVQGLNLAGMQVAAPGSQINMHAAPPGTKGYNAAQWNAYIQAYASDSLPGGVNAPAQPKTVQQQMQDYLKSITAFRHDLGALTKGHLNKDLLKQLIAAGPVQGDALAQSIMGGQGGIGAVNKLWAQINQQAKALGMTAAHDVYGPVQHGKQVKVGVHADAGPVHALQSAINQLHGKTVVIQVQIEQGGGAGGIKLSKAELSTVTHQVQKSLLQQAKRNRRTGLQLQGYGA